MVMATLGELVLTAALGVETRTVPGVVSLCPEVATVAGDPVGVDVRGVPEGPVTLTMVGVLTLGVVEVVNLGPCVDRVVTLGELVRTPVEGLVNRCPMP